MTETELNRRLEFARQERSENVIRLFTFPIRALKHYFRRQTDKNKLYQMTDYQLSDIGVTRGDIENIV